MKTKLFALVATMMAFMAPEVLAAANLGEVAGNIQTSVESFKTLIIQIGFVIGIGLFVLGLFLIYKDSQESGRGHLKNGLIAMLVGAMLVSMGAILDTTTSTALGGSDAGTTGTFQGQNF